MRTFFLVLVLLYLCHSILPGQATREAVENGLTPSVLIKGKDSPQFSIQERMRFYQVPAVSIAFWENGKIQWAAAYNLPDTGEPPVDTSTLFQAASISKPVAAAGMLSLIFSHGGSNEGYKCYFLTFARKNGPGLAVMTNGDRGAALFGGIIRSFSLQYGWNIFEPQIKEIYPMEPTVLAAFAGLYKDEKAKLGIEMKPE